MERNIDVYEDVMERNSRLAAEVNADLTRRGVFAVNLMGSPGSGKTTTLLKLLPQLGAPAFVIEGDIQSDIDTRLLSAAGIPAVQINTGGACHLDSPLQGQAFPDSLQTLSGRWRLCQGRHRHRRGRLAVRPRRR